MQSLEDMERDKKGHPCYTTCRAPEDEEICLFLTSSEVVKAWISQESRRGIYDLF